MSIAIINKMRDKRLVILGNNIRAERMRKRLSQMALAEMIDISKDSMQKIENSNQTPSAFILYDIANALGISIEELFKDVPKDKS